MAENRFPLERKSLSRDSAEVISRYAFVSRDCLCTSGPRLFCQGTPSMNGMPLPDPWQGGYMIGGIVREGENIIEVRGAEGNAPVYLSGEFGVWLTEEGWVVDKAQALDLGLLSEQGFPFYSGTVVYRQSYDVPSGGGKHILRVPKWEGTSCEVLVNGVSVAAYARHSFKLDIGPYLTPGPNDLELCISGSDGAFGLLKAFTLK